MIVLDELAEWSAWPALWCVVRGVDGRAHGPLPWGRAFALLRSLPCRGPVGADLVVVEAPAANASPAAGQLGFGW